MRISPAETLRIPEEGSSAQGKSGPKLRPKGVGDGQSVENPIPPKRRSSEVVTQKDRLSTEMEGRVQACRRVEEANPLNQDSEVLRGARLRAK